MEAANQPQRSRLILVTLGHFLNDSYGSFFAPILPVLIEKLSLSLTAASGLAAIPSITSALFQPLYGMASDRIRGRFFIILGPLLSVVCMGALAAAGWPGRRGVSPAGRGRGWDREWRTSGFGDCGIYVRWESRVCRWAT